MARTLERSPSASNSVTIRLPELHPGQAQVERESARWNALVCGRRWGKTKFLTRRMALRAIGGKRYGYFAATYKLLQEVFDEAAHRLSPIGEVRKSERRIVLKTGGMIEFWTLEDEDAGRSRRYHEIGVDEAGLVKDLEKRWYEAIRPTLMDFKGEAWLAGTPKGRNFFATAYALGQDPEQEEWASWRMPTLSNPYIDPAEIEAARLGMPDRSFRQEILAEFIDEAGGVFRGVREAIREPSGVSQAPFTIGVDLARVEDFTVLTAMDATGQQLEIVRFNQIAWERQIGEILTFAAKYPGAKVFLDSTGVGDPIYERLRQAGLNVQGYKFSNQSKEALIDNLAMLIEQQRVGLLPNLVQIDELLAYQYSLTQARNVTMNAPPGMHDDTVIALALAAWTLAPRQQVQVFVGNPNA